MPAAVRYTVSDGLHIALRVDGEGPPDVVLCEPSSASFDHLADFLPWAGFVERLTRFARVITFDRRGTGLSDRPSRPEQISLEARADDLLAVLDAVGSESAAVLGIAAGSGLVPCLRRRIRSALLPSSSTIRAPWHLGAGLPMGVHRAGPRRAGEVHRARVGTREWAENDLNDFSRVAPSLAADPQCSIAGLPLHDAARRSPKRSLANSYAPAWSAAESTSLTIVRTSCSVVR